MSKSNKGFGLLILVGVIFYIVKEIVTGIYTIIADNIISIITVILSVFSVFIVYKLYSEIYFVSRKFKCIKESISAHINNCNELNDYIEELKRSYIINIESYNYGYGKIIDNSVYHFQRKEWSKIVQRRETYHCSSIVCKNASAQPIKYLCKYFNIESNEDSLCKFEKVLNDFLSVEQGKYLVIKERNTIIGSIDNSIPFLIKTFSENKLIKKLGFEKVDITNAYMPTFTFQYVSAGGNSSSKCDIILNIENLNCLINYLDDLIKRKKSIIGQRVLMTPQLREEIKKRDNYKCCYCNLGIKDEPNLLLEIDHIVPLSKGGMTTYDNLQTLCWKCNRNKGAKILD